MSNGYDAVIYGNGTSYMDYEHQGDMLSGLVIFDGSKKTYLRINEWLYEIKGYDSTLYNIGQFDLGDMRVAYLSIGDMCFGWNSFSKEIGERTGKEIIDKHRGIFRILNLENNGDSYTFSAKIYHDMTIDNYLLYKFDAHIDISSGRLAIKDYKDGKMHQINGIPLDMRHMVFDSVNLNDMVVHLRG